MLTGNEKIKDLNDNDILNWLCNELGTKCTKGYFEHANNYLGKYRILHVELEKPFTTHRISFCNDFANNRTLKEIKSVILWSREERRKHADAKIYNRKFT